MALIGSDVEGKNKTHGRQQELLDLWRGPLN
jgi:hypothetical protein